MLSYPAPFSHASSVLFSIIITLLWEERAGLYPSRAFVCFSCIRCLFTFFSSSWCRGRAAAGL